MVRHETGRPYLMCPIAWISFATATMKLIANCAIFGQLGPWGAGLATATLLTLASLTRDGR